MQSLSVFGRAVRRLLAAAVIAPLPFAVVHAQPQTYVYSGNPYLPTNPNVIPVRALTVSITLDGPLPANCNVFDTVCSELTARVLSWSASDGVLTRNSSSPLVGGPNYASSLSFFAGTQNGNIVAWVFGASGSSQTSLTFPYVTEVFGIEMGYIPAIPPIPLLKDPDNLFQERMFYSRDSNFLNANQLQQSVNLEYIGGFNDAGGVDIAPNPGTWSVVVPEPGTAGLVAMSLACLLVFARRRSRAG